MVQQHPHHQNPLPLSQPEPPQDGLGPAEEFGHSPSSPALRELSWSPGGIAHAQANLNPHQMLCLFSVANSVEKKKQNLTKTKKQRLCCRLPQRGQPAVPAVPPAVLGCPRGNQGLCADGRTLHLCSALSQDNFTQRSWGNPTAELPPGLPQPPRASSRRVHAARSMPLWKRGTGHSFPSLSACSMSVMVLGAV